MSVDFEESLINPPDGCKYLSCTGSSEFFIYLILFRKRNV